MVAVPTSDQNKPAVGIAFIVIGMLCVSINDMLIKQLSGDYPLHQMIFVRSAIGITFSLLMVQFEGGFKILHTTTPGLHLLRAILVVLANMAFFAALAVMPLADATALFFIAPLLITVLSIPFLGERVGPRRLVAVLIGLCGVLVMLRPGSAWAKDAPDGLTLLLPVFAALAYAMMQILTRRLGITSKASAMAVYIQGTFLLVSAAFWLIAGDGRFGVGVENESLVFLLRSWHWPEDKDQLLFVGLGMCSAIIGYALSQAYRLADAAVIAPFEYIALPLAIMWGWLFWAELPSAHTALGIALIMGAGIFVFLRERKRRTQLTSRRTLRRW